MGRPRPTEAVGRSLPRQTSALSLIWALLALAGRGPRDASPSAAEPALKRSHQKPRIRPQAWAAGAPLLLLSAMLGLQATADGKLRAQPRLPAGVELIEVAGLRHRGHGHRLLAGADGFELASD
jgi:hypothetical protein